MSRIYSGVLLLLMTLRPSYGQSIFATIVGTVTDATSAPVAGAKIAVTNVRTNEQRQYLTNDAGTYEINNLFPGVYTIEAEMAGFAEYRKEQIQLASEETVGTDVKVEVSVLATEISATVVVSARIEAEAATLVDVGSPKPVQTL